MPRHSSIAASLYEAQTRRAFLAGARLGFGSIALADLLRSDAQAESHSLPTGISHFAPKAKSVIWLFMIGGTSHLESFDPKPALNEYAGKSIDDTPWKDVLTSPYLANERIAAPDANGLIR